MQSEIESAKSVIVTSRTDGIRINATALHEVLCQPAIVNKPLAIVGIAGCLRTGKSFLMNLITRYLRHSGNRDHWIGDDETVANDGVEWKGGRKVHTEGIVIWNEVFVVEKRNGEEIAVLLLDTQGLFDQTMTKEDNTKLFTLTVFLCSFLMLNIKDKIDERELESLEFFTEFARTAANDGEREKPFQDLMFLIRDWQHYEDNAHGMNGGREYLDEILTSVPNSQLNEVRKNLRSSFHDLSCYLMPYPGMKVTSPKFSGKNKDIDENFREHASGLAREIFSLVRARSHLGKEFTGRTLWNFLVECDKAFEGGSIPTVQNVMPALAEARNRIAVVESEEIYMEHMKQACKDNQSDVDKLKEHHAEAQRKAIEHFEAETKFGGEKHRVSFRENLFLKFQFRFEDMSQRSDLLKVQARNLSSQKVHEFRTGYKEQMREKIAGDHQEDESLQKMHEMCKKEAIRSYQQDTSANASYVPEHVSLLVADIEHFFEKMKTVNSEREMLQILSTQSGRVLEYDGSMFLHYLSQQYRDEYEKFNAMYIEQSQLEKQIGELRQSYLSIFENNWNENGANIDIFRARFIEILNEEGNDALEMNNRNKEIFDDTIEEVITSKKVDYKDLMGKVLKDSYLKPSDLNKAHDTTKAQIRDNIKEELAEMDVVVRQGALTKAAAEIDLMYPQIRKENEANKVLEMPELDPSHIFDILKQATQLMTKLAIAIPKYMGIIRKIASSCKAIKSSLPSLSWVAADQGALTTALPSATTLAIGGAVAVGVVTLTVVAYCVYRHHRNKQINEQNN